MPRKTASEDMETEEPGVTTPEHKDDARPYTKMIKDALRVDDEWQKACDDIEKLYGTLQQLGGETRDRGFQIFFANIEVSKNVIYSRPPRPTVVGRFNDRRPLIRKASEMLERVTTTSFELGRVHDEVLLPIRDNMAMFGRGVPWMRYKAQKKGQKFSERVCWEWVHRRDFLHDPARCWYDVGWSARRKFYTERQGRKRFDSRDGKGRISERRWHGITYTTKPNDRDEDYKFEQKAEVWELWHKESGDVIWVHLDKDEVLDRRPASEVLADLDGFFPHPRPAFGPREVDTLKPLPDVLQYKDQIEEICTLTRRMAALTNNLKLKGFYPSGAEELGDAIERLFAEEDEDRAILEGLSNFAAIGGAALKDSIAWLPIKEVVEAIRSCVELRRQLIDDVFQISGINDIMRGTVDPNEKLGQTEMKGQYGSVRIREKQGEMVRLADDMLAMQAEVIAEQFQPETLLEMSQMHELPRHADVQQKLDQATHELQKAQLAMQAPVMAGPQGIPPQGGQPGQPPAPAGPDPKAMEAAQQAIGQLQKQIQELKQTVTFEQVIELFRQQRIRPFTLKIATDSTIAPDENAEKQARTEFVGALAQLLPMLAQMVMTQPFSTPFAIELLKFATAPFRAGRELEGSIDDFAEGAKESAAQPKPPGPEQIKAEAEKQRMQFEGEKAKGEAAARAQEAQARANEQQRADAKAAAEQAAQAREQERRDQVELAKANAELERIRMQGEADKAKYAHELRKMEHDERMAELQLKKGEQDLELARHRVTEAKTPKPNGKDEEHVR